MKTYFLTLYDVPMHNRLYKVDVSIFGNRVNILRARIKEYSKSLLKPNMSVDEAYFESISKLALEKFELLKNMGIL